ncbi:Abi family protein [Marinilactibacillus sp. Marseille-P9653]|uniref:Abi family protein n=1 Tax=Marinilactibacillus sp. Marseille-P9653 TaxID=2866583 RepID=UPI001CE4466F|nr:Abi family protein [Marinilactibacillus sp. Marseille-P9653]
MFTYKTLEYVDFLFKEKDKIKLKPTTKPYDVKKFKSTNDLIKHLNTADWNPISFNKDEYREACVFLKYTNYYYFSIYRKQLPRINSRRYTFSEVMSLYNFDQWLREELNKVTGVIEIMLRSTLTRELGNNYTGELEKAELYLDPNIYNSQKSYRESLSMIEHRISASKSEPIMHHKNNKDYSIPLWVLVDELTFGELCRFVESLDEGYRNYWIINAFPKKHMKKYIFSWFRVAWYMRNVCAHYSRIYGRYFTAVRPQLMKQEKKLAGKKGDDNQDLFAYLLAFKHLVSFNNHYKRKGWNEFIDQLENRIDTYPELILCSKMGFPENWKVLLSI